MSKESIKQQKWLTIGRLSTYRLNLDPSTKKVPITHKGTDQSTPDNSDSIFCYTESSLVDVVEMCSFLLFAMDYIFPNCRNRIKKIGQ